MRYVLEGVMDVEALRTPGPNELFVNAVNVHTGCMRVFGAGDISIDAVLASACAPLMFQAAQIEGESYWDGSYGSNPALWPLYETSLKVDILMVELTPLRRAETPTTAKTILNRINEIASINGLVAELRSLNAINRNAVHADIRMHVVSLPDAGSSMAMEPSIKRALGPVLFESLRRRGYAAGEAWLAANREAIGSRVLSTSKTAIWRATFDRSVCRSMWRDRRSHKISCDSVAPHANTRPFDHGLQSQQASLPRRVPPGWPWPSAPRALRAFRCRQPPPC